MDPLYLGEEMSPEETDKFIEDLAFQIVRRRLSVPAIVLLESAKPLTFVASSAMVVFDPLVSFFIRTGYYMKFQKILEDREKVEKLILAIERIEDERNLKEKVKKNEKGGN